MFKLWTLLWCPIWETDTIFVSHLISPFVQAILCDARWCSNYCHYFFNEAEVHLFYFSVQWLILGIYTVYLHKTLEMVFLVSQARITHYKHILLVELLLVGLKTLYSECLLLGHLQCSEWSCTGSDLVNEERMKFHFLLFYQNFLNITQTLKVVPS